ncbi:pseudouridine synthase [Ignavigranum ruoffiae]|uniref:pseudouridine synthase n=1 Tax=Ignavigranum ruoffiae TaxID=89093 RepID=UPI0023542B01|nr:pseudouridine synthase [Ignavigranum ruoffiae]
MRLDKLLAHAGLGTRRQVKKMIQAGTVEIDQEVIKDPAFQVDPKLVKITCEGQAVHYQQYYYLMLNKPAGIVSATEDHYYETVIDWVAADYSHVDLFPVGRLDRDTTGLLLLTNHGQLAHQLLSPKQEVGKVYRAWVQGRVEANVITAFADGIDLGDFITLPAQLSIINYDPAQDRTYIEVEIYEGKFHQVKRMFVAFDHQVLTLQRIQMGPIVLDPNLALGQYRPLKPEEMQQLKPFGLIE